MPVRRQSDASGPLRSRRRNRSFHQPPSDTLFLPAPDDIDFDDVNRAISHNAGQKAEWLIFIVDGNEQQAFRKGLLQHVERQRRWLIGDRAGLMQSPKGIDLDGSEERQLVGLGRTDRPNA